MKVYYAAQLQKRQGAANSNSSDSDANANCTSTDGHSGDMDTIDYGGYRSAREEKDLSDTTIMSMPSETSYQQCGNQSLAIHFDPTGRYLLIPGRTYSRVSNVLMDATVSIVCCC